MDKPSLNCCKFLTVICDFNLLGSAEMPAILQVNKRGQCSDATKTTIICIVTPISEHRLQQIHKGLGCLDLVCLYLLTEIYKI